MFKFEFCLFGLTVFVANTEACKYAYKLAKKRGSKIADLNDPDTLFWHWYKTPLQQWMFAFQEFVRHPLTFDRVDFDDDGLAFVHWRIR